VAVTLEWGWNVRKNAVNVLLKAVMGVLLLALPMWVAAGTFTTSFTGAGAFEHDSNLFDLEKGFAPPGFPHSTMHADSWYAATGTAATKYDWSGQTLYADLSGNHTSYDYFSELDHYEYKVDAGWKGEFAGIWNASLQATRDQAMVPFLELTAPILSLSTQTRADAGFGVRFLPSWRLEGSGFDRTVTWPLPGEPNLKLKESQGQLTLEYMGTAALSSGLSVGYLSGQVSGALDPLLDPSYHQASASLVAHYVKGGSTLDAEAGYTERKSPGATIATTAINAASGGSGSIIYLNQLTGKTSLKLNVARAFTAYLTNSGAEIDNTALLSVLWQATFKIGVTAEYAYDYSQFPGQGNAPAGSNRGDHVQSESIKIGYQALRWLGIDTYAKYQSRDSNLIGGNFYGSIVGVDLTLKYDP
jgi:hypothetical protein